MLKGRFIQAQELFRKGVSRQQREIPVPKHGRGDEHRLDRRQARVWVFISFIAAGVGCDKTLRNADQGRQRLGDEAKHRV